MRHSRELAARSRGGLVAMLFAVVTWTWAAAAAAQQGDSASAAGEAELRVERCKTPRHAVASVFATLEADQVRCLDDASSLALRLERAERIRAVFSGKHTLTPNDFPDAADAGGKQELVLDRAYPKVILRRDPSGAWLWANRSLLMVDEL